MTDLTDIKARIDADAAWTHPGKFEGESALTVYLYERMLDGDGDIEPDCESPCECCDDEDSYTCDCPTITTFEIDAEGARVFDTAPGTYGLAESEQGFVSSWFEHGPANGREE